MNAPIALALVAFLALQAGAAPARGEAALPPLAVVIGGERINGSGRVIEDPRALAGFSGVHAVGPVDIELKAAEHDAVTVRADDNIAPLIETRVTGGDRPALEISVKKGVSLKTRHTPRVVVEFRSLSELVVRGSGAARADRIVAEDFLLSMVGSGDVRIESLQATRFAASLSGSGDLFVAGRAEQQAIRIAGSGDVNARRLEGRGVQIAIAGSGDALVHASETLDATIAGSGDVVYRGTPRVTQRIRGSGAVRRAH